MAEKIDRKHIAPCGMNCTICISFFGYTLNGKKRKTSCTGCRSRSKNCAFLKIQCETLAKQEVMYCFECDDFPCESLNRLDRSHKEKYHMSMIKNLRDIKEHGIVAFIKSEKEKWTCPICESIICCHNGICFTCGYKLILNKTR